MITICKKCRKIVQYHIDGYCEECLEEPQERVYELDDLPPGHWSYGTSPTNPHQDDIDNGLIPDWFTER